MGTAGDGPQDALEAALTHGLTHGLNVVDSAANYRAGQAESVVGGVLRRLAGRGELSRDEIVLASKGGYLLPGEDPGARRHSIEPGSLMRQLRRSLDRLGIASLDVYLVHNPEDQLFASDRASFDAAIRRAFESLERACAEGLVAWYGVATWHGLRVPADHHAHLDLAGLKRVAAEAAGGEDHFRFIELPISAVAPEALLDLQCLAGRRVSPLAAAADLGLSVFASAALGGPRAARKNDARAATRIARSLPGVATALVGAGHLSHAVALTAAAGDPMLDLTELAAGLTP
ncbi:MAG: hypothetical protein QOG42_726 [Solirubrobacteraceae bacterium]|jgi:aryl-alcohol dehydrogenase-like predicted oxidoreductase|nr:hypothetical protein [Solirubrobacteraceae bacterium]